MLNVNCIWKKREWGCILRKLQTLVKSIKVFENNKCQAESWHCISLWVCSLPWVSERHSTVPSSDACSNGKLLLSKMVAFLPLALPIFLPGFT